MCIRLKTEIKLRLAKFVPRVHNDELLWISLCSVCLTDDFECIVLISFFSYYLVYKITKLEIYVFITKLSYLSITLYNRKSSGRHHIGGVIDSVLTSSVGDLGFEPRLILKIGICCFSAKHVALMRKSKDWLDGNQDNMSEWGDMSIRRLLFQ